jgi:hypothetical protein
MAQGAGKDICSLPPAGCSPGTQYCQRLTQTYDHNLAGIIMYITIPMTSGTDTTTSYVVAQCLKLLRFPCCFTCNLTVPVMTLVVRKFVVLLHVTVIDVG